MNHSISTLSTHLQNEWELITQKAQLQLEATNKENDRAREHDRIHAKESYERDMTELINRLNELQTQRSILNEQLKYLDDNIIQVNANLLNLQKQLTINNTLYTADNSSTNTNKSNSSTTIPLSTTSATNIGNILRIYFTIIYILEPDI